MARRRERLLIVWLLDDRYLFTGELAWDHERDDLVTFRDACWNTWDQLARSIARLVDYRFEWLLAGHGGTALRPADEMQRSLSELAARMTARARCNERGRIATFARA